MNTYKKSLSIGAFFDFDQTLLDTESSRLGFKYLWERRLISLGFPGIIGLLAQGLPFNFQLDQKQLPFQAGLLISLLIRNMLMICLERFPVFRLVFIIESKVLMPKQISVRFNQSMKKKVKLKF